MSDLNRYQDQSNYRMIDPEYFGTPKPEFYPFDLDKAMECLKDHQEIKQSGRFRRMLSYFTDVKAIERGTKRSELQAQQIMTRFLLY